MIQIPMKSLVVEAFVSNAVVVTQVAGFHISSNLERCAHPQ